MTEILALIGFSFVSSVTPGPNNVLLWASGATFGFRRTVPHVLGTALGIGAMALAAAAGLAALVAAIPALALVMKVAGSVYLLYLAWQIARSGSLAATASARPMSLLQGASFQLVNPKAWVFALGAVTTFRPAAMAPVTGTIVIALVMMAVIVPSASLWAGFGGALGRLLADGTARRVTSVVLAILVVLTIVLVWI